MKASSHDVTPEKQVTPNEQDGNEEPASLASMTDLAASIELQLTQLGSRLFELQELRYASTAMNSEQPQSSNANGDASTHVEQQTRSIDSVLSSLNEEIDDVHRDSLNLRSNVEKLPDNVTKANLLDKLSDMQSQLDQVQSQAETFHEELKDDKYLSVFNVCAQQAEEMMHSLDKIVHACSEFVWDVQLRAENRAGQSRRRHESVSTASSSSNSKTGPAVLQDPQSIQATLQTYITLHRSLHAKRKYYEPSTARVLDLLLKGISERKTKNGEVLRRYADLRTRYQNLLKDIAKVQDDMDLAQDLIREHLDEGKKRSPENGNRILSKTQSSASNIKTDSPTTRRLTSRLSSFGAAPPVPAIPSAYSDSSSPPTKSTFKKSSHTSADHRLTQRSSVFGSPTNQRSVSSPAFSGNASGSAIHSDRPQWNSSLKRDPTMHEFSRLTPRKSVGSSSLSSYSYSTPPSRSLSPSFDSPLLRPLYLSADRPLSPSGISSVSGLSIGDPLPLEEEFKRSPTAKPRPSSPESRIPAPSPKVHHFRSATPFGSSVFVADNTFTERAASPTPSRGSLSSSLPLSSTGTRIRKSSDNPNRHGTPSETLAAHSTNHRTRGSSQASRTPSRQSLANRRSQLLTPEPAIRAQAARINKAQRPSLSNRKSTSNLNGSILQPKNSRQSFINTFNGESHDGMLSPTIMLDDRTLPSSYRPNPIDVLDIAIADIVNAQPLCIQVERIDLPLNRFAAQEQRPEDKTARYSFAGGKAVQCKLVERKKGGEITRKVMCKVGADWQDLELVVLDLQAAM